MMGTVWLRLAPVQESIQPFINAIVWEALITEYLLKLTLYIVVLWLGIHVLHGRRICASIPRRPRYFHQRTRQWPLRRYRLHDCEFRHWSPLFVLVRPPLNLICSFDR